MWATGKIALAAAVLALAPCGVAQAGSPELSVPAERLERALSCPSGFTHTDRDPVLLVHGTTTNARESWSWNYVRALPAAGYDVCTVDLPDRSLGDIQPAAEYVVHAVRAMSARSGRQVDVIGHSQGPLEPRWAIRWWDDVRASVDDQIAISAPHHGALTSDALCTLPRCLPAALQMRSGARFLRVLNAGDETPGVVDYTNVISTSDGLVVPASTSRLDGASNVVIQELCAGRIVDHFRILFDNAAYAIVMDALSHDGPAAPERIDGAACARDAMPHATYGDALAGGLELALKGLPAAILHEQVQEEPPLAPYARYPAEP